MSAAYVGITAPLGASAEADGISLGASERRVERSEAWRRSLLNAPSLGRALAAGRVVAAPIGRDEVGADELARADEAWRRGSSGWRLGASRGDGVRDPDEGLGGVTLGGRR